MTLTDFNSINPLKDQIGWALVSTIFLSIGVNLVKAGIDFYFEVKQILRERSNRKNLENYKMRAPKVVLKMNNLVLNDVQIEDLTALP